MHSKMIAQQIIDVNKAIFDNSFNAITVLQDHTEKMVGLFLEQATLFPLEGRKVISEWIESYKKGRQDYKEAVDNNFKTVENYFVGAADTMGFSIYEFMERTDQSMRNVTDKIKKASVDVMDKSMQTVAAVTDKTWTPKNAVRKKKIASGKRSTGLTKVIRKINKAGKI